MAKKDLSVIIAEHEWAYFVENFEKIKFVTKLLSKLLIDKKTS